MKTKLTFIAVAAAVLIYSGSSPALSAASSKPPKTKTPTPTSSPIVTPTPTIIYQPPVSQIKGINYNPISIGTYQLDSLAPAYDVPQIAALGANTIGTYNAGLFEWGSQSDVTASQPFYEATARLADQLGLKLIVGYFSNESMDWTDTTRVAKATSQYQKLVTDTKNRSSTYIYLIGNELFEKLPSDSARLSYAKWIGDMTNWTHSVDQIHKVTYADNHIFTALPWLKNYAPNLDIYSLNTYEWTNVSELTTIIDRVSSIWPGKQILLHEWGVDSLDNSSGNQNFSAQADRISYLAGVINQAVAFRPLLIGSVYFEYTDQWDKMGSSGTQDKQSVSWKCTTCFDGVANEEYWGLAAAALASQASARYQKPSFSSLQSVWK